MLETIPLHMSLVVRKPEFCIYENKDADQLRGNREADQRFVFATRIVQSLYILNPKFQALSNLVCVGLGRNPEDRFSHNEAHIMPEMERILITIAHYRIYLYRKWSTKPLNPNFYTVKKVYTGIIFCISSISASEHRMRVRLRTTFMV